MKNPDLDKRTKEDLCRQIKDIAEEYVPEWRFNRAQPDMAAALAILYASLLEKTLLQYNKLPQVHRDFFFRHFRNSNYGAKKSRGVYDVPIS